MDGPPGSQGIILRRGKKGRKSGKGPTPFSPAKETAAGAEDTDKGGSADPANASTSPPPQQPPGSTSESSAPSRPSQGRSTDGVRRGGGLEATATSSASPEVTREWSHPNAPIKGLSLQQVFLRASGYSSASASAHSSHAARSSSTFATSFDLLPYPRGIINNSNFCFMNSIMQALIFIPSFAQLAVSAVEETETCPTLAALGKWMVQYWKPGFTRQCMQPPRLAFALTGGGAKSGGRAPVVDGSSQQDAQEFLQRLLEVVHDELKQLEVAALRGADGADSVTRGGSVRDEDTAQNDDTSAPNGKGWTVVKGKERLTVRAHQDRDGARSLLLDSVFGGTIESHLKGKSKQRDHASVVVEPFYCLPVDVGFQMECTIEAALERTMTTERIYDADRDKELRKTLMLRRLPNVLLLHIRRWAVTAEGELVKLENKVKYGRTLVLPRSVCSDDKLSNKERTYRLLSVIVHRGAATGRGHYVTYLTANVASPANMSVVGGGGNGPEPYSKQQMQAIQQQGRALDLSDSKGKPSRGSNNSNGNSGGVGGAVAARHPLEGAAQVLLCNDAKTAICQAPEMLNETAYFLVYQRAG